jgi:tetratricopeptide (TPR) repeat protein
MALALPRSVLPSSSTGPLTQSGCSRTRRPPWPLGLWVLAVCLGPGEGTNAGVADAANRLGIGASGRWEVNTGSLLVDYFQRFVDDHDFEAFRDRVAARYTEETLCRILSDSPVATARRAAVVSLGLLGSFRQSNGVLGRALRDRDGAVRKLAEDALWSIWFRADVPENNRALQEVLHLLGSGQLDRAEALATRLIRVAPNFAEAYNQRAIIYYHQGRFAESALDCQRVLIRNPYHFGAISGLAQCELQLNRPIDALKTLRRALKLQPYSEGLRENIKLIEAQVAPGGPP